MRYAFALAPLILFAWLPVVGQEVVKGVRTGATEISAPVLLPSTPTVSTPRHCDELDGVVKFSVMVDTAGLPSEVKEIEASDLRLVDFATELAETQHFKPATLDGSPTSVFIELTVGLHTCAQREKDPTDQNFYRLTLRAHPLMALAIVAHPPAEVVVLRTRNEAIPTDQVGGHISAPVPTVIVDPELPVSGKLRKRGFCLVGVAIDGSGIPQDVHVARGLEPELDGYAMDAAKSWRFKPALRDGNVPVVIAGTIVATFAYVDKEPVAFAIFYPETPDKIEEAIAHHDPGQIDIEPLNADEVVARYKPQSRISGRCLVSLVIDTYGVPQNVHIVKGLDSSLDMDTVAMVEHTRFKLVMKDGSTPAPIGLILPVRYRRQLEKPLWHDVFVEALGFGILFL